MVPGLLFFHPVASVPNTMRSGQQLLPPAPPREEGVWEPTFVKSDPFTRCLGQFREPGALLTHWLHGHKEPRFLGGVLAPSRHPVGRTVRSNVHLDAWALVCGEWPLCLWVVTPRMTDGQSFGDLS